MQEWYIEQALDVEWTHAVAPRAHILYVGAANAAKGLDLALNEVVDKHLANVVSNSWGMPESDASKGEVRALNSVFQQAQAQGMGIFFASGDDGDNRAAFGSVSGGFPDSSPFVTSVGGTSLAVGSSGQRLWETGWGTTEMNWANGAWAERFPGYFLYGGGGGASAIYAKPSYQDGIVPGTQRAEPDVSLVADPQTGVLFTQTYSKPGGEHRAEGVVDRRHQPVGAADGGHRHARERGPATAARIPQPAAVPAGGQLGLQRHHAQRPQPWPCCATG